MRQVIWLWVAVLIGVGGGCCGQPGLFQKVHDSMVTVQSFYDPLIRQDLDGNGIAKTAVVAADTTLLLAATLQQQWCPNSSNTQQLELQAREARKLAQEAGVAEAVAALGQTSRKGTE
jgi:hypothetical protein